jgi:hypothetical protein
MASILLEEILYILQENYQKWEHNWFKLIQNDLSASAISQEKTRD